MAWTSPTSIDTTTGIGSFLNYISEITHFWFGRMLMISIFVIFLFGYISKRDGDWIGGLAVASYVTFVLGLIFWVIGLVTGLDFAIIIGVVIISSAILFTQKPN